MGDSDHHTAGDVLHVEQGTTLCIPEKYYNSFKQGSLEFDKKSTTGFGRETCRAGGGDAPKLLRYLPPLSSKKVGWESPQLSIGRLVIQSYNSSHNF